MNKNKIIFRCYLLIIFFYFSHSLTQNADLPLKIRQAQGQLASLIRDIKFNTTDIKGIGRAIMQSRKSTDRIKKSFDMLQKYNEKFKKNISEGQQELANTQRILKELQAKALSITSEARQRAAEAQRLSRSTAEIDRSVGLANKLEATIKNGESLLTSMQNQINKVEVIYGGLAK